MLSCASVCISQKPAYVANTGNDITVVYDIKVKDDKKEAGIEETYNGGIKTFMQSGNNTRIRMVTLMRVQNVYFRRTGNGTKILVSKESGKDKYKYVVSGDEWKQLNNRYENAQCTIEKDSIQIAGYYCKRAKVKLQNGTVITAYFTELLPSVSKEIEPMFACIPGFVLKYEYAQKNGTLIFQAAKVKRNKISETVFNEPGGEYALKNSSD